MKYVFWAVLLTVVTTIISGLLILPLLKKLKAGQTVLKYVKIHENKNGTPTMGGLFFIIPSSLIYFLFFGFENRLATLSVCIGLAYMCVGFLDDFIKVKFKKNEGLKPYQKIVFQTSIAIIAGVFVWVNGLDVFYLPFSTVTIRLGIFCIPVVIIVFLAITNSVNLTDGLDGLAGNSAIYYLIFLCLITHFQISRSGYLYNDVKEFENLISLSCCLIGGLVGFLLFNVGKASVFMGDTGSLSIGGFIGCVSIFSFNSLLIPFLGAVFLASALSVIIQVVHFKKTGKRVFLMSPVHHHIQLLGYSEGKISYLYSLVTCIMGVLLLISYL